MTDAFYELFHSSVPFILQALATEPQTATMMATARGMDDSGLQRTLKLLMAKGYTKRIRTPKGWVWSLTAKGADAAPVVIACAAQLNKISSGVIPDA